MGKFCLAEGDKIDLEVVDLGNDLTDGPTLNATFEIPPVLDTVSEPGWMLLLCGFH